MASSPARPPEHPGAALLVGVGASAGGVEALTALVRALPSGLDAAVLVVLHVSPSGTSALPQILDRAGPLPVAAAVDGELPRAGHIYVAPADRHLLVGDDGRIVLSAGPRENGHRPAVDPTFRALAAWGPRAVGVVLSGTRDDGTSGLAELVAAGGTALVQDPTEAAYDGMIRSALAHVEVAATLPVAALADHLVALSRSTPAMPSHLHHDEQPAERTSTRFICPECGGHLTREQTPDLVRYACEVGHVYGPGTLDAEQGVALERAMWEATRLLGDRSALLEELASRATGAGHDRTARDFREKAERAKEARDVLRDLVESGRIPTAGGDAVPD